MARIVTRACPNAKTARHHPRLGRLLARRGGCWPSVGFSSVESLLSRAPNGQPSNPKHLLTIRHAAAIFTRSTPDTAKPASKRRAAPFQWSSHGQGNRVYSSEARVGALVGHPPKNAGALWRGGRPPACPSEIRVRLAAAFPSSVSQRILMRLRGKPLAIENVMRSYSWLCLELSP